MSIIINGGDKEGIQKNITSILEFVGEDVSREGLQKTPQRVEKMWKEVTQGYTKNIAELFESIFTSENNNMVIVKDIEFYSHCEHHLVPFYGKVHIAYIPNGKVLGLSKFARLVDAYSQRLQIQEQFTKQIADAIQEYLSPKGVIVLVEAKHMCMMMRGIKKQNSSTTTLETTGIFKEDATQREEFYTLLGKE